MCYLAGVMHGEHDDNLCLHCPCIQENPALSTCSSPENTDILNLRALNFFI